MTSAHSCSDLSDASSPDCSTTKGVNPVFGEPSYPGPSPLPISKNRLMVRGLPESANVAKLESIFDQFGPIVRIRILEHEATGKPKGSAIVHYPYETPDVAISTTRNLQYGDHPLEVKFLDPATDLRTSSTLIMNDVPESTRSDFSKLFDSIGPIVALYMPKGKNRDFHRAYVTFEDEQDAEVAFEKLDGLNYESVTLKLEWAHTADY